MADQEIIKIKIIGYLNVHIFGTSEEIAAGIDEKPDIVEDLCLILFHQGKLDYRLSRYFLARRDDKGDRQ